MSGALGRLPYPQLDVSSDANQLQSYLDQISQLHSLTSDLRSPPQALPSDWRYANNPVGTETTQSMGPSEGLDPLAYLTPDGGGVTQSQVEAANAPRREVGTPVAMATVLGMTGDAPGAKALRAYHGTPHEFAPTPDNPLGQFDLSKVNTGEGAQAYGHGIYLADNEAVAQRYRDDLSRQVTAGGDPITASNSGERYALASLQSWVRSGGPLSEAPEQVRADIDAGRAGFSTPAAQRQGRAAIAQWEKAGLDTASGGHMYETEVNADPTHMLDWDKPLSQQSPHVQDVLGKLGLMDPPPAKWFGPSKPAGQSVPHWSSEGGVWVRPEGDGFVYGTKWPYDAENVAGRAGTMEEAQTKAVKLAPRYADYIPGSEAHRRLAEGFGYRADRGEYVNAAQTLRDNGIPGIRYLDEGSRGSGGGTSNHVIFDPKTINIIRRYGIGAVIGGGGAAALSGQGDDS